MREPLKAALYTPTGCGRTLGTFWVPGCLGKGSAESCEILKGRKSPLEDPHSVPGISGLEKSEPQCWAAFLLSAPWAGLPRVSLHLAEKTSPSVGLSLGLGVDKGARSFLRRVRGLESQFL